MNITLLRRWYTWTAPRCANLFLALVFVIFPGISSDEGGEYCQNEELTANCGPNDVIVMTQALYGRMELSRCIKKDYGYIGCSSDVIDIAHAFCSGRRECVLDVPNELLDAQTQCPEDFKSYLKASYICRQVISGDADRCRTSSSLELTEPEGIIASVVTHETECGSYKAPWVIKAPPGQQITLFLFDYSIIPLAASETPSSTGACVAYASIREKGGTRPWTVCGGREREKLVYTSTSNVVEVIIQGSPQNARNFLLQYKTVGCVDLPAPRYGWSRREGQDLKLGCNSSKDEWKLTCRHGTWDGFVGNCTKDGSGGSAWSGFTISIGLSIAIVALIALTIAGCILLAGLVCVHKRRRGAPQKKSIEENTMNEQNYRQTYYGALPPAKDDPYWCPPSINGENEYASIQENMSNGVSNGSGGSDDMGRGAVRNIPPQYCEFPPPNMAAQQQPNFPPNTRKCSGVVNVVPDNNGELREYFVLDPENINRSLRATQLSRAAIAAATGPSHFDCATGPSFDCAIGGR